MAMPEALTYTEAMRRLQKIADQLESGGVMIDDLNALLLESHELIRFCEEKLRSIDQTIEGLEE